MALRTLFDVYLIYITVWVLGPVSAKRHVCSLEMFTSVQ